MPIIDKNLAQEHRITRILSALKIPMSTYSEWIDWEPSAQEIEHNNLRIAVKSIYTVNKGIYGYRRIAKTMQDLFKMAISERFVWQLMSEAGIKSRMQRRYNKPTTVNDKDQMPNLIGNLDDLSGVLTTDITYIQLTDKTWVYMASAYDPKNRKVLSYQIADTMTAQLATSVITKALRRGEKPLYVHSDMGSQYTSELFENTLESVGIRHSYSRKGHPYDNARIESFHSLLKRELVYQLAFESINDVQAAVGWYINWYNNTRISLRDAA
ncbi:IS3 family transposase [Weissella cibaria]|uniref:IS3 family transposase n=1 Tax=Weissella cibaria TaxID=137591 RepID=UPI003CCC6F3D